MRCAARAVSSSFDGTFLLAWLVWVAYFANVRHVERCKLLLPRVERLLAHTELAGDLPHGRAARALTKRFLRPELSRVSISSCCLPLAPGDARKKTSNLVRISPGRARSKTPH